jgi:hypothetical protein
VGLLKRAVEGLHVVMVWHTLPGALALLFDAFFPWALTTSTTLRAFITAGAVVGGLLGLFVTAFVFGRVSKAKRIGWMFAHFALWLLSYGLFVLGPLGIISPHLVATNQTAQTTREFLLKFSPALNSIEFFGSLLAAYCLIAAIVLISPKVAAPSSKP